MNVDIAFLTAAEERELAKLALAGDMSARNRIVLGISRLIWRAALRLASPRHDHDELAQVGFLKVLKAFGHFDPEFGTRASTFFLRAAIREMRRFAICEDHLIDVPAYTAATHDGLPKHARIAAAADKALAVGTLDAVPPGSLDGSTETLGAMLADPGHSPEDETELREDLRELRRAITALPKRLRVIIEMRMDGRTLGAVGLALGITHQGARIGEEQAMKRLRHSMHVPLPG
jgi:RNA polymerase sigma factor (sigma-70 family)